MGVERGGRLLRDEVVTHEDSVSLDTNTILNPAPDYIPVLQGTKQAFNEFLPKVALSYDVTDNQTVGVSYNKGYRTGFMQLTLDKANPNVRFLGTVNPEYLDAYEVSYRSNWFGKTFDLNGNAFYYDYQDQQIAVLDRFFDADIENAGSSHAYGAELEARWRPIASLQLHASVGWLQSEFDEFTVRGKDFSGNEYPVAPAYTLSAGAMYRSTRGWFVGADISHTDGYFSSLGVANDPRTFVDAYTIVDARAGWEWEKYTLTVFAKNLFDERYLTSTKAFAEPLDPEYGFIGDERTVGVTLTSRF